MGVAYSLARADSHRKILGFLGMVVALIALIAGSAWNGEMGANPVFVFVGAVVTWAGTTLLYAGFLGGGWETRALMRVMEELQLMLEAEERRVF